MTVNNRVETVSGARMRRAAVSKALLVGLGIVLVAAVVFWFFKVRGDSGAIGGTSKTEVTLYCATCGEVKFATKSVKDVPWKGNKFQCPKCKNFTAAFEKPEKLPGNVAAP